MGLLHKIDNQKIDMTEEQHKKRKTQQENDTTKERHDNRQNDNTTLAYGRAGACCACSRCGMGGLGFCVFFLNLIYPIFLFLMPHLLGDGWTFRNTVVLAVLTQR